MVDVVPDQAWVQLPKDEDLYPPAHRGGGYNFGFALGMSKLLRAQPRLGTAFSAMYDEVMFSPEGVLTREECELVAGVTAAAQDCYY